jgi:gamma-glutamyl hydrolase
MDCYVQFVKSAGARVVPIYYNGDWEEELKKLEKVNGLILPGGASNGLDYLEFVTAAFNKAKEINDNGVHFPIWGTCLGF